MHRKSSTTKFTACIGRTSPKVCIGALESCLVNSCPGPPTQAAAREELLFEECARKLAGVGGEGVTEAVATALDIERDQCVCPYQYH